MIKFNLFLYPYLMHHVSFTTNINVYITPIALAETGKTGGMTETCQLKMTKQMFLPRPCAYSGIDKYFITL